MDRNEKIKVLTEYITIKHKLELIDTKIELIESSMLPAGMRMKEVQAHGDAYTLEDYVVDLEKLEREKRKFEIKLEKVKKRILHETQKLDSELEIKVVSKRYLHNQTWESISDELNYSKTHIIRIHRNALNKMFESRR